MVEVNVVIPQHIEVVQDFSVVGNLLRTLEGFSLSNSSIRGGFAK